LEEGSTIANCIKRTKGPKGRSAFKKVTEMGGDGRPDKERPLFGSNRVISLSGRGRGERSHNIIGWFIQEKKSRPRCKKSRLSTIGKGSAVVRTVRCGGTVKVAQSKGDRPQPKQEAPEQREAYVETKVQSKRRKRQRKQYEKGKKDRTSPFVKDGGDRNTCHHLSQANAKQRKKGYYEG